MAIAAHLQAFWRLSGRLLPSDLSAAVLDGLGSLVDKSPVEAAAQRDGSTRCRLLETVRLYALARLESAEKTGDLQLLGRITWVEPMLLNRKGDAAFMRGDLTGAIPLSTQSAAVASDYSELGLIHHTIGKHEAADLNVLGALGQEIRSLERQSQVP